jgi:hypothetical protein
MTLYDGSGSNAPRPSGWTNRHPLKKLRAKRQGRRIEKAVNAPVGARRGTPRGRG